MQLLPIRASIIVPEDDLLRILCRNFPEPEHGDIVVVSSKAVATAEGRIIDLKSLGISDEAENYAEKCGRSPEFMQAVLDEIDFRGGKAVGVCQGAILTELKPQGLREGIILTANAGMDESNCPTGCAIGWPADPAESARGLRADLKARIENRKTQMLNSKQAAGHKSQNPKPRTQNIKPSQDRECQTPNVAVIISDSCCRPGRWGVTAYALAAAGIDPLQDQSGRKDLFGRKLRITLEAVADQLSTAANILMGNANQGVPAVIVRNHELELSDYEGWVPGIGKDDDLFG